MPSTDRLTEFAAVAASQSISEASRVLGVERATLSRRMSNLEAELGVRLLHRSTSRLVLTPAGEELHARARQIVVDAQEAWSAVRRMDEVPRGLLRIASVGTVLDEMLVDYVHAFPEVEVEIVDASRAAGLVSEHIDVALRIGPISELNLIVRRVGVTVDRFVVASPGYLERYGVPMSVDDLAEHRCIVCAKGTWPLRDGGSIPIAGRLRGVDMRLAKVAACAEVGIALVAAPYIRDELASGKLVRVLPDQVGDAADVSIVFADREYIDPKVRAFIDRAVPALEMAFRPAQTD